MAGFIEGIDRGQFVLFPDRLADGELRRDRRRAKCKAVNNRDNVTKGKIASRIAHREADVERSITQMVRIDRQEEAAARAEDVEHLFRRHGRIRPEIARLKEMGQALADAPDGQISLTDPDARAMATSARYSGLVGQNVQSAVDTETDPRIAQDVANQGFDRGELGSMANAAKAAFGWDDRNAIADKGDFSTPKSLPATKLASPRPCRGPRPWVMRIRAAGPKPLLPAIRSRCLPGRSPSLILR